MSVAPMRFGVFLAPFHRFPENPTLALERDLELLEWLDRLGYDEAWVGEHHSAGWETIASPELFIAAALARTRHIRLGTGVVSLPYHHPLMVANRMVVAGIRRLGEVSGGYGGLMVMAHEWASRERTLRSYELLARHVMPHFQGSLESIERSYRDAVAKAEVIKQAGERAIEAAHRAYDERRPPA